MVFVAQNAEHAEAAGSGAYIDPDPIFTAMGGDITARMRLASRPALQMVCEWFNIPIRDTARKDEIVPAVIAKIADGVITWDSLHAKMHGVQNVGPGLASGSPSLPTPMDKTQAEQLYREQLEGYTPFELRSFLTEFGAPVHKKLRKDEIVDMLVDIEIHGTKPTLPTRLMEATDGNEQHDVS